MTQVHDVTILVQEREVSCSLFVKPRENGDLVIQSSSGTPWDIITVYCNPNHDAPGGRAHLAHTDCDVYVGDEIHCADGRQYAYAAECHSVRLYPYEGKSPLLTATCQTLRNTPHILAAVAMAAKEMLVFNA